jgi:hypothetical protein
MPVLRVNAIYCVPLRELRLPMMKRLTFQTKNDALLCLKKKFKDFLMEMKEITRCDIPTKRNVIQNFEKQTSTYKKLCSVLQIQIRSTVQYRRQGPDLDHWLCKYPCQIIALFWC